MKTGSRNVSAAITVAVISTTLCLFLVSEASAAWPTTAATRCWSAGPGIYIKSRIRPTGDAFYSVSSIIIMNKTIHNIESGTAYLKGNYVYQTAISTGKDANAMWASQTYSVINKNTLTGQWEEIVHDKNYSDGSLDTDHQGGPLTLAPVSCTTIWK